MLKWDVRLQARYGIYYAAAFATVLDIVVAVWVIFSPSGRRLIVPAMLMLSLAATTYFFMVALMLFEKDENVLEGLIVTPMRHLDYLLSKAASLTLVTMLAALTVTIAVWISPRGSASTTINWHWIVLGGLSMGMIATFLGVWFGSRYDSFNTALLPSTMIIAVLNLPLIHYFGLFRSPLFYLLPSQGPMALFGATFLGFGNPTLAAWELPAAILSAIVWVGISFVLARSAFGRFVVRSKGVYA